MKEHSFYQFALRVRGRKDSKGDLAEEIFNDLSFPKHEKDFNQLSDYIEMQSDISVPMSEFDDLYEEYIEWLKF